MARWVAIDIADWSLEILLDYAVDPPAQHHGNVFDNCRNALFQAVAWQVLLSIFGLAVQLTSSILLLCSPGFAAR